MPDAAGVSGGARGRIGIEPTATPFFTRVRLRARAGDANARALLPRARGRAGGRSDWTASTAWRDASGARLRKWHIMSRIGELQIDNSPSNDVCKIMKQ